jgi:hypothetical protein
MESCIINDIDFFVEDLIAMINYNEYINDEVDSGNLIRLILKMLRIATALSTF